MGFGVGGGGGDGMEALVGELGAGGERGGCWWGARWALGES